MNGRATLEAHATGEIVAHAQGYAASLGVFGEDAASWMKKLGAGLPATTVAAGEKVSKLLVARLAARGLLEFGLTASSGEELAVIEPQVADYWPQTATLHDSDRLVLSRFAYLRRRGTDFVLESPRADALFRLRDPNIAAILALLATPHSLKELRRSKHFFDATLLGLLLHSQLLMKAEVADGAALRRREGDEQLVLWDFHDLLFHARSTEGRHANPLGGAYPHAGAIAPLPAVRPGWSGKTVELPEPQALSSFAELLRRRRSARSFDDDHPITLQELSTFLDRSARVLSRWSDPSTDDGGHTSRPYPTAGAAYELELYLGVARCEGLERGFYHYDAGAHALAALPAQESDFEASLAQAAQAMGVAVAPQILIVVASRFGRISWKYSAIAYSLILKDVGALSQNFYLTATDMQLGGCAIGISNIDLFARLTGLALHVEGAVGQFALGRGVK
ncbi:dehydrogenase [Methylocystis bryophila]|uniref:Dehydrogenase n=1 Tax=Methylocystis bryophila TaxID=655015 RepID=A0A1W6N252_9HYPH|nr:dehydrogenase [Methylocystis bryophila]